MSSKCKHVSRSIHIYGKISNVNTDSVSSDVLGIKVATNIEKHYKASEVLYNCDWFGDGIVKITQKVEIVKRRLHISLRDLQLICIVKYTQNIHIHHSMRIFVENSRVSDTATV